MSPASTGSPVSYRTPLRRWNVYVSPPSVGVGSDVARFATTPLPCTPPARRVPTSPSLVNAASR